MQFWYESGPKPREWWRPGYPLTLQAGKETKTVRVEIEGIRSAECPKSRILRTPQASDLIQIVNQESGARGALGKPSTWPADFYDAVSAMKRAEAADRSAQRLAIAKV